MKMCCFLKENIISIKNKIEKIKKEIKRKDNIYILGATKTVSKKIIIKSIKLGIDFIGENKVQELLEKYKIIGDNIKWHFIGHLQKNKVKYIIDKVDLIHSVDSLSLAKEISKRAKKINKIQDVLLEVNISKEKNKFGIFENDIFYFIDKIKNIDNIRVRGLMAIAPNIKNKKILHDKFKNLKKIKEKILSLKIKNINMDYLSMGMSNDFEIAVMEGANILRIGSLLYGSRKY